MAPPHSSPLLANDGTMSSPKHIRKRSFQLTPSWSKRHLLAEEAGTPPPALPTPKLPSTDEKKSDTSSDSDDEVMQLKYFPLLHDHAKDIPIVLKPRLAIDTKSISSGGDSDSVFGDDDDVEHPHDAEHIWEDVPMGKPDAILGIAVAYRACTAPNKVNVAVGAYRDANGKPWVLPCVRQAEQLLWESHEPKEYLPIEGDRDYVRLALQFAYGAELVEHLEDQLAAVQTLSGTGACRIGACFLAKFWPKHPIYVPNPTWGNHINIFKQAGLSVQQYRYYDKPTNSLDLTGLLEDVEAAPNGSIIVLHACAHNPTGCDPTIGEWKQIIEVIKQKEHIAFFDCAYQGFASGNPEADAQPFRYAVSQHVPILLAQSFAKNFGLYGERCGTLSIVCGDAVQRERITSCLRNIIRPMYSSPPRHGSSIVKTVLASPQLRQQFEGECASMAQRIQTMRARLVQALHEAGSTRDWSHVTRQIGMFAFTGLTPEQCRELTRKHFIFLTTNGRISIAGLNGGNIEHVAQAIHAVTSSESIAD